MKVILLEAINKLGKVGDVVTVKEGFARNFLIPQNKARLATAGNMKTLESLKKKEAVETAKQIEAARAIANKIASLSITISAEAGDEDKLFGSITSETVSDALKEEGVVIDKKDVIIEEPIKKLGVFQITIKVHPEVKASLRLWIVKK
jgi:ribosomal protein L9